MIRARIAPIAATGLVGLVVLTVLALAPGAGGSPHAYGCALPGLRYVGKTSQKKDLCFTLTRNRKVLREYAFDYADNCGTGVARVVNPRGGVVPLTPTGVFLRMTFEGFFKGTVKPRTATGTMRVQSEDTVPGTGTVKCDTRVLRWSAHRLVGATGPTGAAGATGSSGSDGATGPTGPTG